MVIMLGFCFVKINSLSEEIEHLKRDYLSEDDIKRITSQTVFFYYVLSFDLSDTVEYLPKLMESMLNYLEFNEQVHMVIKFFEKVGPILHEVYPDKLETLINEAEQKINIFLDKNSQRKDPSYEKQLVEGFIRQQLQKATKGLKKEKTEFIVPDLIRVKN